MVTILYFIVGIFTMAAAILRAYTAGVEKKRKISIGEYDTYILSTIVVVLMFISGIAFFAAAVFSVGA